MMVVEDRCSICDRKIGGKLQNKELRIMLFRPDEQMTFRSSEGLCLCNRCAQSFNSWMRNRRQKKTGD